MTLINKLLASIALISLTLSPLAVAADAHPHRVVHARAAQNHRQVHPPVRRTDEEVANIQRRASKACRSPSNNVAVKKTSTSSSKPEPTDDPEAETPNPESSGKSGKSGKSSGGGPSFGGKKVGLGWSSKAGNADITKIITDKTGFVYTWSANCPAKAVQHGLICGTMLWGQKMLTQFRKARGNAKVLMGMNEVNQHDQANMSVKEGLAMWKKEIVPYRKGKKIISPSCNQSPSGYTWLKQFLAGLKDDEKPDALSVHIYTTNAQSLINQMEDYYKQFKMPLWLTEFACQDYSGQNKPCEDPTKFMKTVTAWLDKTDYVEMYVPFGWKEELGHLNAKNRLITSTGVITPLGKIVVGMTH